MPHNHKKNGHSVPKRLLITKTEAAVVLVIILVIGVIYTAMQTHSTTSTSSLPTTQSSTAYTPLQLSDFNVGSSSGCLDPTKSNGKTFARFYITISNRLNESLHYTNISLVASVLLDNGTKLSIPQAQVQGLPAYLSTAQFPIHVGVTGGDLDGTRATMITGTLYIYWAERNQPILANVMITIQPNLPQCSN